MLRGWAVRSYKGLLSRSVRLPNSMYFQCFRTCCFAHRSNRRPRSLLPWLKWNIEKVLVRSIAFGTTCVRENGIRKAEARAEAVVLWTLSVYLLFTMKTVLSWYRLNAEFYNDIIIWNAPSVWEQLWCRSASASA